MLSAKLRNTDGVGVGVFIGALFSISRVLYLLDVYYTSQTVVCQVKFLPQRGTENTEIRSIRIGHGLILTGFLRQNRLDS